MTIEEIYLAGLTREEDDRVTPVPIPTEDEWWLWWQAHKKERQTDRRKAIDAVDDALDDEDIEPARD